MRPPYFPTFLSIPRARSIALDFVYWAGSDGGDGHEGREVVTKPLAPGFPPTLCYTPSPLARGHLVPRAIGLSHRFVPR